MNEIGGCAQAEKWVMTHLALSNGLLDLFNLDFAEAFHLEKRLTCRSVDRLPTSVSSMPLEGTRPNSNSVVAICFELGDICSSNAWYNSKR